MPPKCQGCDDVHDLRVEVAAIRTELDKFVASQGVLLESLRADLRAERKQNLYLMFASLLLVAGGSEASQGLIKLALAFVSPGA